MTSDSVVVDGDAERWTDEGSGPVVLLLHGIYAGAGGHEWHELVPHLTAAGRTARVADLLGFAGSDRPARQFTPGLLERSVAALIEAAPEDATVVASSLTGAYAVAVLAAAPRRHRLVLVTPTGLGGTQRRPSRPGRYLETALRRSPAGDLLTRLLVSPPSVRWFLRHQAYRDETLVTEEVVHRHVEAGSHPQAKYPLVAFVGGQLARPVDPAHVAALRPVVVWGDGQRFTSAGEADGWAAAGAEVVHLGAGLPQAEEPAALAAAVLGADS